MVNEKLQSIHYDLVNIRTAINGAAEGAFYTENLYGLLSVIEIADKLFEETLDKLDSMVIIKEDEENEG